MNETPDRIAQLDQVTTDLQRWADVYGKFFRALLEAGFERPEAVDIIMGWQSGQAAAMVARVLFDEENV